MSKNNDEQKEQPLAGISLKRACGSKMALKIEVVCVIGVTSVLGDVLLAELYWRTTQGRSLHSSLPMPTPKLQRYTYPLYTIRFLAEIAIAFRYSLFLNHSRYCWVFVRAIFMQISFVFLAKEYQLECISIKKDRAGLPGGSAGAVETHERTLQRAQ